MELEGNQLVWSRDRRMAHLLALEEGKFDHIEQVDLAEEQRQFALDNRLV